MVCWKAEIEKKQGFCLMTKSLLFHAQGVRGFEHVRWDWSGGSATVVIRRQKDKFRCVACHSADVTATPVNKRIVKGLPLGSQPFELEVQMHRLKCHDCGAFRMERLQFLPGAHAHITRRLQRSIIELRAEMSISAIAKYFDLDWKTVKNAEKDHLKRKYRRIRLCDVTTIGIDEIYIGHKRYKTVVRDLDSGAVLFVGDGRGADTLEKFGRSLASSKATIQTVAMDMAGGYTAWARKALPKAVIVYDHFHLIKLMNEKLDKIRRRTVNELDKQQAALLKKNVSSC